MAGKEKKKKNKLELLDLKIYRSPSDDVKKRLQNNANIYLWIKVHPLIEELFKHEVIEESTIYKTPEGAPLKFYAWGAYDADTATELERLARTVGAKISSYGTAFGDEYRGWNYSILRTVGISNGVEISLNGLISIDVLDKWAKNLKEFVKLLYTQLKPATIVTKLTVVEED